MSYGDIQMKYDLSDDDIHRLENWNYHKPHTDQPERYEMINEATRDVAELLMRCCPKSRQLSLAITKLEEARMWANNSIACNEEA